MAKLTNIQLDAALLIHSRNKDGIGAIMPYAELIVAANELNALGLAEDRGGTDRRWLTNAGRLVLSTKTTD